MISIRSMKESDLEKIAKLAVLANPHARDKNRPDRVTEEYMKNIRYWLENFSELAFIAEEDEKVVGYVAGEVIGKIGIIEDIAVARTHQGRGIGSMLMKKELNALKAKGAEVAMVEVHYKNSAAVPFYYGFKFRISGFMRNRFGFGHDAIILEKILKS